VKKKKQKKMSQKKVPKSFQEKKDRVKIVKKEKRMIRRGEVNIPEEKQNKFFSKIKNIKKNISKEKEEKEELSEEMVLPLFI
jgi:hypothetical protein